MNYSALVMTIITIITAQITAILLAKFRFPTKKLLVLLAIQTIFSTITSCFCLYYFGIDNSGNWFFLTVDLPLLLMFLYVTKRRDLRDLFTIFISMFLSFAISIPAKMLSSLLGNGYWWYDLFRAILYAIILYLIYKFVRKPYLQIQDEIKKGWGIFCVLPLIGLLVLYYKYLLYSRNGDFSAIVFDCSVTVVIIGIVFVVFNYVFEQLHEKFMVQEQQRILFMQSKAQRDYFEQQKDAAEKTNRRWHDLRHNMQELIELMESGDTQTAISYLKEQRGVDEVPNEQYCLHLAVNSILCLWAERSRKAGITLEIKTDIPEKLKIEPMELSALFANAFENAVEGCLRLSKGVPKFIKVNAYYNGKRLAIGFTNSCLQIIDFHEGMPMSSKTGGGIGTRSIAYTVQRYRGSTFFEAKEGVFSARFILNI